MGNEVSSASTLNDTVKVVLSDGTVHEFEKPITAAELMLDYPQQVVVEYRPEAAGARTKSLPADEKLETKRVYLMLPMRRGKQAEELRRVLFSANAVFRSQSQLSYTGVIPLIAKAVSRGGRRVLIDGKGRGIRDEAAAERKSVPESLEMERPEYLSRQLSGKGWKPSLDTIKEKKIERKLSHWLF